MSNNQRRPRPNQNRNSGYGSGPRPRGRGGYGYGGGPGTSQPSDGYNRQAPAGAPMSQNAPSQQPGQQGGEPPFGIQASRNFASWLATQNMGLAFSTYKIGKVFWIGVNNGGKLSIMQRQFPRCMGIAADENGYFAVAALWQIWLLRDLLQKGQTHEGYDRFYAPRVGYVTGDLDVHDVAILGGEIYFVNTLFACISKVVVDRNFELVWKPKFISKLAAEDRCHLNGMAIRDGKPAFVTAVATTDIREGWREHKREGGVVIDVASNEIVCRGLSMPHSPRWYRDRLWVHNSGQGEFGYVDLKTGKFESVCFCPGYLRGMSFSGDYAIVGLSKSRTERAFSGLALGEKLEKHGVSERAGCFVIDLKRGDIVQQLEVTGKASELFDVLALPGCKNPGAIGIFGNEAHFMLRFDG